MNFCEPEDFDSVKGNKYITLMGGVDDATFKKLVEKAVGDKETASLANKGTKKMYMKEGVWAPDQKVLIFTGSDSEAAADARMESRDTWMPLLQEWFSLEEGPDSLKAY